MPKFSVEIKPASPGKHPERAAIGLTYDWKFVTLQLQNSEGEAVEVILTQSQAFVLAGNIQGNAFLVRE